MRYEEEKSAFADTMQVRVVRSTQRPVVLILLLVLVAVCFCSCKHVSFAFVTVEAFVLS